MACLLLLRQRLLQAHVGSGHIVEGLEKDHPLLPPLAVFTKARRLPHQGGQGLPQGQVDSFDQSRADAKAQMGQTFGANHDARTECQQLALMFLFDQLPVDQSGMGLTAWLAGPPSLPSARKRRHDMEGSDQGRQIAREAVAEERRDARDPCLRDRHDLLGGVECPWSHNGREHQPKLGRKADPDPLPPIRAVWQAFACRIRLLSMLASDEVPHLIELHLGDRQVAQQVVVDRFGLMGCPPEPCQHGLFGDPEHKADAGQINTDQEHFEGHHDLVFRGAEIEKDRLARLRKWRLTSVTAKDTAFTALREVGCDSTHVPLLHSSIMRARGIGARLPPIFGFPHNYAR